MRLDGYKAGPWHALVMRNAAGIILNQRIVHRGPMMAQSGESI
jgi:hypothetical protein